MDPQILAEVLFVEIAISGFLTGIFVLLDAITHWLVPLLSPSAGMHGFERVPLVEALRRAARRMRYLI